MDWTKLLIVAIIGGVIAGLLTAALVRQQIDAGLRGKTGGLLHL